MFLTNSSTSTSSVSLKQLGIGFHQETSLTPQLLPPEVKRLKERTLHLPALSKSKQSISIGKDNRSASVLPTHIKKICLICQKNSIF